MDDDRSQLTYTDDSSSRLVSTNEGQGSHSPIYTVASQFIHWQSQHVRAAHSSPQLSANGKSTETVEVESFLFTPREVKKNHHFSLDNDVHGDGTRNTVGGGLQNVRSPLLTPCYDNKIALYKLQYFRMLRDMVYSRFLT